MLDPRFLASELTDDERAVRDAFVDEYFKDFDPVQACLRVGFQINFAHEFAQKFMVETYVQRKIAERKVREEDPETQGARDKALVMSVLREAAQNGAYNTRVAAASKMATILGIDRPEDTSLAAEQMLVDAFRDFAEKVGG